MVLAGKTLIAAGCVIILLGVVLYFAPSVPWLGRLPGDIRVERPGGVFFFPLTTCILLSVALSGVLYLISRSR